MSSWSMSIGWLRFTVPCSTVEILKRVLGEGDWIRDEKGYEGYREVWICRGNDSGYGRIATGAKRAPREFHVDLSQELISHWTYEKFHQLAEWVLDQKGHFGRIDVALDDRLGVIDVDGVYEAVAKGHCVSHFRQCRIIGGLDVPTGADRGKTLALGSRQSESYLRIYDKAAEQRAKEKPVEGPWMRWEMEWKRERAQAVGLALSTLDQDSFQRYIVGVFRTAVDFRDCTRADDPKDRYYAPILPWWKILTEGMARAKLAIVQAVKTIEQVKRWAEKSLAPTLSLLCAHPEAGERWLVRTIVDGVDRWRSKHLALLQHGRDLEKTKRRLHWWNPRDGFSAAYGSGMA
ncbi:MAG: replication initiation factor domain-containing protein [Nitrospira sp.]|nr:replication initiation factor domain-containing protein [Nitrospira sp.]MDH4357120.1 replication initiation factor domain-containing protein [Nitrospira sp.]MDH5318166.1 replication initiation factor domain-containing protein [Nitrospira sp.]